MSMKTLLQQEIKNELKELEKMQIGTETYKTTVDGITKLVDRVVEMENFDIENDEKIKSREIETDLRLIQMKEDRKDRIVKNLLSVAGIVIPSVITIWGTIKSIEFEKDGTITTIMGRGFIQKLLPKK